MGKKKYEDLIEAITIHNFKDGDVLFLKMDRYRGSSIYWEQMGRWVEDVSSRLNTLLGFPVPIAIIDKDTEIEIVRFTKEQK